MSLPDSHRRGRRLPLTRVNALPTAKRLIISSLHTVYQGNEYYHFLTLAVLSLLWHCTRHTDILVVLCN